MKKVLFTAIILSSFVATTAFTTSESALVIIETNVADEYCEGWEDGYCEGWKDVKGQFAICPITPICPLPEIGKDRYRDGYNRGFKAGSRAAQR
jgi:hypothetical protein